MEKCSECENNICNYIKCGKCKSIFCKNCCSKKCLICKCSSLINYSNVNQDNLYTLTTRKIFAEDSRGIIKEKNDVKNKVDSINEKFDCKIISLNKLKHCKKNYLKCSCCNGKRCDENNCFCFDCMAKNIKKTKFKNKLINKKGHIATQIQKNGKIIYCCHYSFDSQICDGDNICPDCVDLNNNLNIYINLINN